jgi:hypothetical protein
MFKIALVFLLGLGSVAMADDGGVVGIKVGDVKFGIQKYDTQAMKNNYTPVTIDENSGSYVVEFNGKEAAKLMAVIPSTLSVMTGMYKKFPKWVQTYNANSRVLEITSNQDGKPSVEISCFGGDFDFDNSTETQPPKFTPYPDGAHCSVTVQSWNEDNTEFSYDPKKLVCGGH